MSTPPNTALTVSSFGAVGDSGSGSPPSGASVSVGATLNYNGTLIPVTTGDLAKLRSGNFQFTLAQPVALGSIQDFLKWLNTELGLPDLTPDVTSVISTLTSSQIGIVRSLGELLNDIWTAVISITVLSINTGSSQYMLGVTMTLGTPFTIISGLQLNSLGVNVAYNG